MPVSNLIAFLRLECPRSVADARLLEMQINEFASDLQYLQSLGMSQTNATTLFRELQAFDITSASYTSADKAIQQKINVLANPVNDKIVDNLFIYKMPTGWRSPF